MCLGGRRGLIHISCLFFDLRAYLNLFRPSSDTKKTTRVNVFLLLLLSIYYLVRRCCLKKS